MTEKIKTLFTKDIPNWALWAISVSTVAIIGGVVFAATAAADQHNDQRYVRIPDNSRAWENHISMDELRTKPVLDKVAELESQVKRANDQLNYNNRMTERNNAILERLDKR